MVKIENTTLYTAEEVANLFGCSQRTIKRYQDAGKIEGRRMGRTWYFTEENVKRFFNEKEGVKNGK